MMKTKICSRCAIDSNVPNTIFDRKGVCNYCKIHDKWDREFPLNDKRTAKRLVRLIEKIKKHGKGKRYDCIVGISGGCDSSFMLMKAKQFGLKPLAVHWDNNWNTDVAERNMKNALKKLNVDSVRIGVDRVEYDSICKSFLKASVSDADIPNDIGLTTAIYYAAEAFNIKYILGGHSFRTEGMTPLGWTYMDAKYIENVNCKFSNQVLNTFPNLWMKKWLKWLLINRFKRERPLYYMDYNKEDVKKLLKKELNWKYYGGHHLENTYTKFVGSYLLPKKFNIDKRIIEYSALVRSNQMEKEDALEELKKPVTCDKETVKEVKDRLGFSNSEFNDMMKAEHRSYRDYETYHPVFRKYRLFFKLLAHMNLIPKTFYFKYTKI